MVKELHLQTSSPVLFFHVRLRGVGAPQDKPLPSRPGPFPQPTAHTSVQILVRSLPATVDLGTILGLTALWTSHLTFRCATEGLVRPR